MVHDLTSVSQQEDYGINSFTYNSVTRTAGASPPLKLVDIKNPAGTMQWADIGYSRTLNVTLLTTTSIMEYPSFDGIGYIRQTGPTGPFNGRHVGNKGNVAWYDGHVDEQTPIIPTDMGAWTTYSNQVHCGSLTPVAGPVTTAQLASKRNRNSYFFADPESGRLVQSPLSTGSW
jgi:prepilin-type processing-associated H-X9-DG protein